MSISTSAPVRVNAILAAIREHSEAFKDDEPGPADREWAAALFNSYGDEEGPDTILAHTVSAFDYHAEICTALDRLERGYPLC